MLREPTFAEIGIGNRKSNPGNSMWHVKDNPYIAFPYIGCITELCIYGSDCFTADTRVLQ
jgi:hypothetical protein